MYIKKKKERYTWWSKITWRRERQILLIQTGVGRVQSVYTCVFRHIKIKNILLLYIMGGCWKKKDDIMQNNCHLMLPALSISSILYSSTFNHSLQISKAFTHSAIKIISHLHTHTPHMLMKKSLKALKMVWIFPSKIFKQNSQVSYR